MIIFLITRLLGKQWCANCQTGSWSALSGNATLNQRQLLWHINLHNPAMNATWCNRLSQEVLRFELLAWFSYVAERKIVTECCYCGLGGQGSPGVMGGRILGFFLTQGQWDVTCRESLWVRAQEKWGFVLIYWTYLCSDSTMINQ